MADGLPVSLVLVGTNHRHAPIGVRERLAARDHGRELVEDLMLHDAVGEAVGLSTCNRCELYLVGADADAMRDAAVARLAAYSRHGPAELEPLLYVREDAAAAEHLFAVSGGLDSLVPGEAQILSQIRDAHAAAVGSGSTGPVTNRLFRVAVEAGKRVRHETAIGEGGASVASVAAELARERLGGLEHASVAVVGTGRMAELTVANLVARGARGIVVLGRTAAPARALADRFGGRAEPWDALAEAVAAADVVVSSTSSPEPVIGPAIVPAGPRVLIDLAVPRDIAPEVAAVPGAELVHIDQLEDAVRRTIARREGESHHALRIVEEHVAEFTHWLAALEVVPAITQLRALAEQIRLAELERAEGRWESLSEADRERLDALTRSMLAKLLHRPTVRLKQLAAEHDSAAYAEAMADLFGL